MDAAFGGGWFARPPARHTYGVAPPKAPVCGVVVCSSTWPLIGFGK